MALICKICRGKRISRGFKCRKCTVFYDVAYQAYRRCVPTRNEKRQGKRKHPERWGFSSPISMARYLRTLYYKQGRRCFYSGNIMSIEENGGGLKISPDRLLVSGRYDRNNTKLCLDIINFMKTKFTNEEEFFDFSKAVVQYYCVKQVMFRTHTVSDIVMDVCVPIIDRVLRVK